MKHKKTRMKGNGNILDSVNQFLKQSKLISNIGQVVLPALGGLASSFVTANPLGSAIGASAGSSLNQYIKSQGYGKKMNGGAVYEKGQIPLHKLSGAGRKSCYCHKGGNSVFNNVQSSYGKIKM